MYSIIALFTKIKVMLFVAAAQANTKPMESGFLSDLKLSQLISSIVYTLIGIAFFGLVFWLITKFTPFSMRKEIEEDQNISLGIMIGALFLGIAIIIAAAIH